ncbi:MAG: leucine-rich repeat protein [Bacteroidales bacterium]|nr:leucine-rich repeat protein [Bacteroidales bacterium]
MTARISFIFRMVFMGIVSLWMLSCAPQPELDWVPEIMSVSAKVDENTCELTAIMSEALSEDHEFGFMYGEDEESMQRIPARLEDKTFMTSLTSLEYGTDYFYKAYVSNGRNEIFSDIGSFRTGPMIDRGSEEERAIILPFHDITVKSWEKEFMMEIGGDAEFVVNIPQEAVWLKCRRSGRACVFQLQPNKVLADRSCKVVFRNLRTDQTDTLTVCQSAISSDEGHLPFNEVELLTGSTTFSMHLPNKHSVWTFNYMQGEESAKEWLRWSYNYSDDQSMINVFFRVAENTTDQERSCRVIVTYDGRESLLVITQKKWNSVVEFEDPGVRKVCVDAFDLDGDGNLTCYEIHAVPYDGMDYLDFSKVRIKSFDEFRWFTSVSLINQPVFAGTGLESISFPRKVFILQNGVFKNCTELKDVDLTSVTVSDEAFMGCTGLKDVRAVIIGKSAFEGCTGLETVVQLFSDVPPFAFRQCTSLHSFEFEIINVAGGTSVHIIGEEAFRSCTSLPEITIPYLTTEIHDRAFYGCSSLSAVYMDPLVPPTLGEDVFAGTSSELKIFVPSESVGLYKESWPSMADRICVR